MADALADLNFDTLFTVQFDPLKDTLAEIIKRLQAQEIEMKRMKRGSSISSSE